MELIKSLHVYGNNQRMFGFSSMCTAAFPKDCSEIFASGASFSGVYTVQPLGSGGAVNVYCDMETDGGGWTVR